MVEFPKDIEWLVTMSSCVEIFYYTEDIWDGSGSGNIQSCHKKVIVLAGKVPRTQSLDKIRRFLEELYQRRIFSQIYSKNS